MALIIIYTAMVLCFLAFEDGAFSSNKPLEWVVEVLEICFILIFLVDITLKTSAYWLLYWREKINIIDFAAILFIFLFVILDMAIDDKSASMIFRLWGITWIGWIYFIMRKLGEMKHQKQVRAKWSKLELSEIKDPLDKVIEILVYIWDNAEEGFIVRLVDFCLN